jgi:hypothetical protein
MKKFLKFAILILILIGFVVAYYLYIYVPNGELYRLKFTNLKTTNVVGNAKSESAELNDNKFKVRAGFNNVNDSITYTFDIINDGTIPAKLVTNPFYFGLDALTKKYITYTLTDNEDEKIVKGSCINPGETLHVKLVLNFINNPDIATQDSNYWDVTIFFNYLQNR